MMVSLIGSITSFWHALPLLIFVAEICVVTISTVRIIFVARGRKFLASVLGFFEVTLWLFAIGQIMQNLSNIGCYVAFASGFSLGNYLGILIEQKLAMGNSVIRIITHRDPRDLIDGLRAANYGVTRIEGQGARGSAQVILTVIKRKELKNVISIIQRFDPKTFYSVEDLQVASEGIFPTGRDRLQGSLPVPLRLVKVLFGRTGSRGFPINSDALAE